MKLKTTVARIIALLAIAALALCPLGCGGNSSATSGNAVSSNSSQQSISSTTSQGDENAYVFRNNKLLREHYAKHGKAMGFASAEEYEMAASAVATNPKALHKTEKEDGDDMYYLEASNDFVIVSTDGYIRTYFRPDSGKSYFNKQ